MNQDEDQGVSPQNDGVDHGRSRREALVRLGIYGAFTAPALLAVLQSSKAQAQSPIGDPINGVCTIDPPECHFF